MLGYTINIKVAKKKPLKHTEYIDSLILASSVFTALIIEINEGREAESSMQ